MDFTVYGMTISELKNYLSSNIDSKSSLSSQYNLAMLHGLSFEISQQLKENPTLFENYHQGTLGQLLENDFTSLVVVGNDGTCICSCDTFGKLQQQLTQGKYCQHILKILMEILNSSPRQIINDTQYLNLIEQFF